MENQLKILVDNNYYCTTQLFYYGHLPFNIDSIDEVNHTAKVESDRFSELCEIKDFLSTIYSEKETDRLLNRYLDSKPLYYEENGDLYINLDIASRADFPFRWKSFIIESINVDGDSCSFNAKVEYDVDELYVGESVETYEFKAINENGWKLVKAVYKPN